WKPCQVDSLNLLDHRYKRWCCRLIPAESNSLPHAHTQARKTYYKHQDSRIKKAQELNTKTITNSDIQDLPKSYQDYQDNDCQGRLLARFQDDAARTVAIRLELPDQLSRVYSTFHVSNLKKCLPDETLGIPLDEIQIDDKLHFVEEPIEIMDREVKRLKQIRIHYVKVRWNSRRGPELTWEREDRFQKKYPHLIANFAPSLNATT
ncbi:hypothetical protein Tco_1161690, partial [Tanacetum coccineum]